MWLEQSTEPGEGIREEDGGVGRTHPQCLLGHAEDWRLRLRAKILISQKRKSRHREVKWLAWS